MNKSYCQTMTPHSTAKTDHKPADFLSPTVSVRRPIPSLFFGNFVETPSRGNLSVLGYGACPEDLGRLTSSARNGRQTIAFMDTSGTVTNSKMVRSKV